MAQKIIVLTTLLFSLSALATKPGAVAPTWNNQSHTPLTQELKKYVIITGPISEVNYKQWKKNRGPLDNYLKQLSLTPKKAFNSWSKDDRLAFLINAYNGFTIQLILNNYPVKSIKDIGGFFSSPWKKKFFTLFGKKRTLDWIEHEVIRKEYNEPRSHFALNCASIGCPLLLNEAYVGTKLNDQLDKQTKLFLMDTQRNKINFQKKKMEISKIFKWFSEDFEKTHGSVVKFLLEHVKTNEKVSAQDDWDVDYTDYDWELNEVR